MRINHNVSALNAHRQLTANHTAGARSLERLSSGLRINRAGDDAAGLAISEQMRGQIRGLNQATRNAQDGISLIQTAEGALTETHSILQRMRELAVQGANDTLVSSDRAAIGTEIQQLQAEVTRIATDTQFNGQVLLNGNFGVRVTGGTLHVGTDGVTGIQLAGANARTFTLTQTGAGAIELDDGVGNVQRLTGLATTFTGTLNFDRLGVSISVNSIDLSFSGSPAVPWTGSGKTVIAAGSAQNLQIGANEDQSLALSINDMRATALGVDALSVSTHTAAGDAITSLSAAITTVSSQRSTLGAWQNRLEHTINNLGTSAENLNAAESRIRDVDMAKEMMEFTKNNILSQAAQAMLAQANQLPQGVLQLLR